MKTSTLWIQAAVAATCMACSVFADDCGTVKSAMLSSGHTPHTAIVTKTDNQQKKIMTRQIQTLDNKYVQTADGKWYAMNIGIKDLDDNTSSIQTCRRTGSEIVDGELTVVYEVHENLDGDVRDQKMWISPSNRVLKAEGLVQGAVYTTTYDFSHFTPPANAVAMGGR